MSGDGGVHGFVIFLWFVGLFVALMLVEEKGWVGVATLALVLAFPVALYMVGAL